MDQEQRNRSEGWTHAKRDGHAVEQRVAKKVERDASFRVWLLENCGVPASKDIEVSVGGLNEKHVPSVHGDSITGKVDMMIQVASGEPLKISIKKSSGGQGWWLNAERFIEAYECIYAEKIPADVKVFINYFIHCDTEAVLGGKPYLGGGTQKHPCLEHHQQRLSFTTIQAYFPKVASKGLGWFQEKAPRLTELVFARGSCSETTDHAEWLLYFFDDTNYAIHEIAKIVSAVGEISPTDRVCVGPRNGGTTLLFPFGFLQMHQGKMQFHHGFEKVKRLVD